MALKQAHEVLQSFNFPGETKPLVVKKLELNDNREQEEKKKFLLVIDTDEDKEAELKHVSVN